MEPKKPIPVISILILAWSGFVVAAYFVAHKPLVLQVIDPLMRSVWTLIITSILVLNALAIGTFTLRRLIPVAIVVPSLLALAGGIGLGELGLLGFLFAAAGISQFWILLPTQILLLGWLTWQGSLREALSAIRDGITEISSSAQAVPSWMRLAALLALIFTFLMTFLPPADAFDALLYHLTIPARWIRDGGLQPYNFPHYWFPGLVEGIYFWGMGLASDIVPQQIHFAWALFIVILVWDWTRHLWGNVTAWWALILLISMPAFLLLATWAYTDMALSFYGIGMLYALYLGKERNDTRWWNLSAMSAGMAMGVKYTSFVMPLTAVFLIFMWELPKKRKLFADLLRFALISAMVAVVWYLRNWIWMGNPFYPFVFGGRYWDSFRAAWFAGSGTGLGWNPKALILLPLTVTLGYQDINSIDANIGPLLLLTVPLAFWMIGSKKQLELARKITLTTIGFFVLFSVAFWTYGYVTTRNLWQTRLLLPAIIPFVIPASAGIASLRDLNTKQLRLSFIVSSIVALSIYINLLDMGLSVIVRNPLSVVTGIVTGQNYLQRYQPAYANALQMVSQTSPNSRIYSLFEPRSYGMTRNVQPDPILDNFSHDIYLYGDPEHIINGWRQQGYTHVLLNRRAVDTVLNDPDHQAVFQETMDLLNPFLISPDETYELLEIPTPGASENTSKAVKGW